MNGRILASDEKIWVKNGKIHLGSEIYETAQLQKIIVQVSDLTFLEDTVRLMLVFGDETTLIIPSMHKSYDALFEKLNKIVGIDNGAYLRAMNCDITCDFTIFDRATA